MYEWVDPFGGEGFRSPYRLESEEANRAFLTLGSESLSSAGVAALLVIHEELGEAESRYEMLQDDMMRTR